MPTSENIIDAKEFWPPLDVSGWAGTKRSLHLYAQMLGKIRLALSPSQPNWMFTPLYLCARGITTGFVSCELTSVEVTLDVFDSRIVVARSTGDVVSIALLPCRPVSEVYGELSAAMERLNVVCYISTVPQEVPDTTPLHTDGRESEYDPIEVQRWFRAMTAMATIFESWRSQFFGRSGIQLWWGAFDLALILFSGKKVTPPSDRGYLMKYDLDAELMNVGLYVGDETNAPFFYGYIYPEPFGAEHLPIGPAPATWSTQMREWILPYDAVRTLPDPGAAIKLFMDSLYEQCFAAAGWDRGAYLYDAPRR